MTDDTVATQAVAPAPDLKHVRETVVSGFRHFAGAGVDLDVLKPETDAGRALDALIAARVTEMSKPPAAGHMELGKKVADALKMEPSMGKPAEQITVSMVDVAIKNVRQLENELAGGSIYANTKRWKRG